MVKRSVFAAGASALVFLGAGSAVGAPSYCPSGSYAACGGRDIGDILVALHGKGRIFGIQPSTGAVYTFSTALEQFSGIELGDIAVVPSDPLRVVAIGNVDSGIGIRQLDSCGSLSSAVYGPFPETLSAPLPPISKGGTNNRGIVFNPVSGKLYSPGGGYFTYIGGTDYFTALYQFPQGGGPLTVEPAWEPDWANPIQSLQRGTVAADELGTLYIGAGARLTRISAVAGGDGYVTEYTLAGTLPNDMWDIVHDGNHHLFVTGTINEQGMIWRVDTLSGLSELWSSNRGPSYGYEAYNPLYGITLDAQGDILAVESYSSANNRAGVAKISKNDGSLLRYFPLPGGAAELAGAGNQPWSVAVLGVNLPTVREACKSDCAGDDISDCYGSCVPAAYLGDQICDAGPSYGFNCYARGFDNDYCNPCSPGEYPDCNGNCAPQGWVGDSFCDDGSFTHNGQPINLACEAFRFDEATCLGCGWGEMLDCNGNCSPESWYGDGICDDGGWWHLGHPVEYRCVEYDFDGYDCPVGG